MINKRELIKAVRLEEEKAKALGFNTVEEFHNARRIDYILNDSVRDNTPQFILNDMCLKLGGLEAIYKSVGAKKYMQVAERLHAEPFKDTNRRYKFYSYDVYWSGKEWRGIDKDGKALVEGDLFTKIAQKIVYDHISAIAEYKDLLEDREDFVQETVITLLNFLHYLYPVMPEDTNYLGYLDRTMKCRMADRFRRTIQISDKTVEESEGNVIDEF